MYNVFFIAPTFLLSSLLVQDKDRGNVVIYANYLHSVKVLLNLKLIQMRGWVGDFRFQTSIPGSRGVSGGMAFSLAEPLTRYPFPQRTASTCCTTLVKELPAPN